MLEQLSLQKMGNVFFAIDFKENYFVSIILSYCRS